MEHQKTANLLNDEANKPSKFRTRNWVEINDEVRGAYSQHKQIKFKTSIHISRRYIVMYIYLLKEIFSDANILVKRNITVNNTANANAAGNDTNKKIIFKILLHLLTA